jgi:hypothetical protein
VLIATRCGLRDARRDCRGQCRAAWLISVCALALGVALACAPGALGAQTPAALGQISGKVTDASTQAPLQGIEVCAIVTNFELLGEEESESEHAYGCAQTGTGGEYTVSELRAGSFFVEFTVPLESSLNYVAQLYDGKTTVSEASPVAVAAGQTTPNIDAELSAGAEIAGKVTDAITGAPIAKAIACALRTGAKRLEGLSCVFTQAGGEYVLRGVPSGRITVGFIAPGFETQYYNDKSSESEAEFMSIAVPGLTQGINAAMKPRAAEGPTPGAEPSAPSSTGKLPTGVTTPSSPPPDATLSLDARRIKVARDGRALVEVACAGAVSCRAKLTLKLSKAIEVKGKRVVRERSIGTSAVISVAAGHSTIAAIRLDAIARRLLRAAHGRLSAELTLVTPGHVRDESVTLATRTSHRG